MLVEIIINYYQVAEIASEGTIVVRITSTVKYWRLSEDYC